MGLKKKKRGDVWMEILEAWWNQILKEPGVGLREEYEILLRVRAGSSSEKEEREQNEQNWENCLEEVEMESS